MTPGDLDILNGDSWFGALPETRREALLAHIQIRDVANGTRLYHVGDPPNGLHAVIDGEVRLICYPAAGTELLAMLVRPGRWFGELSVIDRRPRPHDAIATRRARIAQIGMAAIDQLTAAAPELWRDIAMLGCAHQRLALGDVRRSRAQSSVARLAGLLIDTFDGTREDRSIRIKQEDLAAIVGVSRQRLNRLLAAFAGDGLIRTVYGGVTVLDTARLRTLSDKD